MAATAPAIEPVTPFPESRVRTGSVIGFGLLAGISLSLALAAPFFAYVFLDRAALDVSAVACGIVLAFLLLTFLLICLQGLMPDPEMRATTSIGAPFIFDHRLVMIGTGPRAARSTRAIWAERLRAEMRWLLRSGEHPSADSGLYRFSLYVWRPAYVWLAIQPLPLLAFWVWRHGDPSHPLTSLRGWLVPMAVLAAVYLLHNAPAQTVFAYGLAAPRVRRHAGWFLADLLWSIAFAAGWRNTIARVAQLRVIFGRNPYAREKREQAQPTPASRQTAGSSMPPSVMEPAAVPPPPVEEPTTGDEEEEEPPAAIAAPPEIEPDSGQTAPPGPLESEEPSIAQQPTAAVAESPIIEEQEPSTDERELVPTIQPPTLSDQPPTNDDTQRVPGTTSNDHESAVHAAQELTSLVEALSRRSAERAQECARLEARVAELEGMLGSQQALTQALSGGPSAQISADELRAMQKTLDSLVQDSTNLIALAEVSRHSVQLAEVLRAYTLIREQQ